jgi:2-polyprenyl-3-methyl-5-hydroxy-6-metoxy-1,4-benzoquinol methylase
MVWNYVNGWWFRLANASRSQNLYVFERELEQGQIIILKRIEMISTGEWKNQDKEYHEDADVVASFDHRIVRKFRIEHKYFTLDKWIDELVANNAKLVMDFGCATGTASLSLSRRGMKVFAIDASSRMIEEVKKKAQRESLNVTCVLGDVEQLPFENNFFDGIICLGVLHHLPNISKGIEEQSRVLKKGGLLFISEPFRHKPWISYPYYMGLDIIKFFVQLFKKQKISTPERTLTFTDLKEILTKLDQCGLEYQITYFIYWSNVFGYLPEFLAYPLVKIVNKINQGSNRGDAIFIKARKKP